MPPVVSCVLDVVILQTYHLAESDQCGPWRDDASNSAKSCEGLLACPLRIRQISTNTLYDGKLFSQWNIHIPPQAEEREEEEQQTGSAWRIVQKQNLNSPRTPGCLRHVPKLEKRNQGGGSSLTATGKGVSVPSFAEQPQRRVMAESRPRTSVMVLLLLLSIHCAKTRG